MMPRLKKMERTGRYIGFRRKRSRRMALLKERNGKAPLAILVIGETIAKRDSEYNTTKMVTNMKACGLLIKNMDKALSGVLKAKNCAVNILEIGLKTKNMEEAPFSTRMVIDMTGIG